MNEQELTNYMKKHTDQLPIPDSVSPERMKEMLDQTDFQHKEDTHTAMPNRHMRRYVAAACMALCFIGIGAAAFLQHKADDSSDMTIASDSAYETAEETADDTSDSKDTLASQGTLTQPESYDDYYDALKENYDAYYDQIASVQSNLIAGYDMAEDTVEVEDFSKGSDAAGSSFADESVATNFSRASKESGATTESTDHSTTNNQEAAVAEGDVIHTDGTYIYKVIPTFDHDTGNYCHMLTITETKDGSLTPVTNINLDEVIQTSQEDYIQFEEFYLQDDTLFFLYNKDSYRELSDASTQSITDTYIVVYDISDRDNPKHVTSLSQSGWYQSSRISNGYLYTISNFTDNSLSTKQPYTNYVPSINGKTIACENIYYDPDVLLETTYVITSLPVNRPEKFTDSIALPVNGGQLYVSDTSIYIYTTLYDNITKTEIMKVAYENGNLTPGNSVTVAGYLYDSFALSEYDGYLRIVATIPANNIALLRSSDFVEDQKGTVSAPKEDVNALYILDSDMALAGKLTGIAPGEKIYSARFMGEIGYFVTFRNTDPLFSVDLSDPANPKLLGELKIPGFSNYLHFYGENKLLGIGEEIDATTGTFKGIKLSMFDISDPANVTEEDKYILENSNYSEALYNHKAIMINPKKNLFGFVYSGSSGVNYEESYRYSTFTYNEEKGFMETACYPVTDGSEYETNGVRGIYIGDYFYLVTNKSITSYEIGSTDAIDQLFLK